MDPRCVPGGGPPPGPPPAERNRVRILRAAEEVFARRGLEAGLDEIARHAGVGTGTVYRRFPDKSLLIDALIERRLDAFEELVERALDSPDAWEGLERFITDAVEMQVADRALSEMLFGSPDNDRLEECRNRLVPVLGELVERAQKAGQLRDDVAVTDLGLLQFMLVAVGAFTEAVSPGLWRRQLRLALDGLKVRRDQPTALPLAPITVEQLNQACALSAPPCPQPLRSREGTD